MPIGAIPYVLAALMALAVIGAAGVKGYLYGRESRESEITDLRVAINTSRAEADRAEKRARETAAQVSIEYRDRIVRIREAAPPPQIIERVVREASTATDCSIVPPSFVCLWNGTASGGVCAEGAPGTTVTVKELAEATSIARERFLANQAQLDALQSLLKEHSGNDH